MATFVCLKALGFIIGDVDINGRRLRDTDLASAFAIFDRGIRGNLYLKKSTLLFIWSLKLEFLVKSLWW